MKSWLFTLGIFPKMAASHAAALKAAGFHIRLLSAHLLLAPLSFTHSSGGAPEEGTHESFAVSYGTGEVRGTVGSDVVRLGGLRLPRQVLGLATDTDGGFCSAACDGLMVRPCAWRCAP